MKHEQTLDRWVAKKLDYSYLPGHSYQIENWSIERCNKEEIRTERVCSISGNGEHLEKYAHLIAAAPELLEALETIATMNSDSNSVSPFALTKLVEQIRIVAKSAISKAKGQ